MPKAKRAFDKGLKFLPDSGANVDFVIYLSPNTDAELSNSAALRARHEADNSKYATDSVEQRVVVDIVPVAAGHGFISSFTDKSLVGLPVKRGDFKMLTVATIYLRGEVFASCELASDESTSVEFKSALQIIGSLHVTNP